MTDRDWLLTHGDFSEDQIEQFIEKVGIMLDGADDKNPRIEWQARMAALAELKKRK